VAALARQFRLAPGFDQKEFLVAEHRGALVGCARLKFLGDTFELASVGVRPSYQHRGVGTLLVRQCLQLADAEVFCLTEKPDFFKRFGFSAVEPGELPSELRSKLRGWCPKTAHAMKHQGDSRARTYRLLLEKCQKDLETTRRALEKVRIAVPQRSHYRMAAEDFLNMARSYFADARHFLEKGDLVNAFAAVNYAHGWLDAGARLGLFDVGLDDRLFTLAE
jgi:N-acetylglutamate synthase-like GNAT family acetyltransferase